MKYVETFESFFLKINFKVVQISHDIFISVRMYLLFSPHYIFDILAYYIYCDNNNIASYFLMPIILIRMKVFETFFMFIVS
jgi:hypothetical protein